MTDQDLYPCVPIKSLNAIFRCNTLKSLLIALAVDPEEAEDLVDDGTVALENIPHGYEDFKARGEKALDAALQTVSQWVANAGAAPIAAHYLVQWNRRLGVWCLASIVEAALRPYVGGDLFHRDTIELVRMYAATGISDHDLSRRQSVYRRSTLGKVWMQSAALLVDLSVGGYRLDKYPSFGSGIASTARESIVRSLIAGGNRDERWVVTEGKVDEDCRRMMADACLHFPR